MRLNCQHWELCNACVCLSNSTVLPCPAVPWLCLSYLVYIILFCLYYLVLSRLLSCLVHCQDLCPVVSCVCACVWRWGGRREVGRGRNGVAVRGVRVVVVLCVIVLG